MGNSSAVNTLSPKLKKIQIDKDRFDAVLRKMAQSKPLPVKDVVGTSPRSKASRREET
jgi:predicted component of type VI protein secretion system